MTEFLELMPPREALRVWLAHISTVIKEEEISTVAALGRVTARPTLAAHPLPAFDRSTVDGYAVRAADTYGASESLPATIKILGEVHMGVAPGFALAPGAGALIYTGGMLPQKADAVVMVEYTQSISPDEIELYRAAAVGENVIRIGEDVQVDDEVIPAGVRLRPAEIGGLMALGYTQVWVAQKPRIGIISSGDELVPPDHPLNAGQVRDINGYNLSALVEIAGGQAVYYGIAPDDYEVMLSMAKYAHQECDVLVITAGSSLSTRDLTAAVIRSLGKPGVLVHGINIRPGKPTILAVCDGKVVIGLPGNPVSALVIACLYVVPVVERLSGLFHKRPTPTIRARLVFNLSSQAGREDWVAVRLFQEINGYRAEPVLGSSNLIFTLVRADGLVCIPADKTGLSSGEYVEVCLLPD